MYPTKQSTTRPCGYLMGHSRSLSISNCHNLFGCPRWHIDLELMPARYFGYTSIQEKIFPRNTIITYLHIKTYRFVIFMSTPVFIYLQLATLMLRLNSSVCFSWACKTWFFSGNFYDIIYQNAKPAPIVSQKWKPHGWFSVLIVDQTDAVNHLWHIDILANHIISASQ